MRADRRSIRHALPAILLLAVLIFAAACSEQEQPFAVGDRATPTPTPTDTEQAQAAAEATPTFTPVPLPTSVPVSLPTSVPTSVPTSTEVPPTPEPTATQAASGQSSGATSAPPSPTPIPEPTATTVTQSTVQPISLVPPTYTPVPIPADYNRNTEGPQRDELIKFAQWDDNRLKLGNWVAAYIIAHGLDHAVRVIDMNPEDYKDALPHAEIDIVMEADPEWAQPYADAGVLVILGPLSGASPDTVVAVNASVWQRAPTVGRFLEQYGWDGELLASESAKIRGGRIAIAENVIGLKFLKNQGSTLGQWVSAETVALVNEALAASKVNLCRAFEFRAVTGNIRVCKDDPRLTTCPGCS